MERSKMVKSSSKTSAAETVLSIEELFTDILVRVPLKPLLRSKCVSKHWLSFISNTAFCHHYTLRNLNSSPNVSAVFRHNSKDFSYLYFPPGHDPTGHDNTSAHWNPLSVITDQHGDVDILNSCNGLLLCCPYGQISRGISTCFVLNPITKQFSRIKVPRVEEKPSYIIDCILALDPHRSPHYNLICIDTIYGPPYRRRRYKILTYSSLTGTWRLPDSIYTINALIGYEGGVYWNGAVHWSGALSDVLCYHIEQERITIVQNDEDFREKKWTTHNDIHKSYLKESSDGSHLLLIDVYKTSYTKFEVLEMGKDYSGWFVKYNVDIEPLCIPRYQGLRHGAFHVLFLEESSSTLCMHTTGHVITCDLKSMTFTLLRLTTDDQKWFVEPINFMYKETLACV